VTVRVPAKINLYLGVGRRRSDGFHSLTTVYQAVSLFDEVTARPADRLKLTVEGEGAEVLAAEPENLASRAASALAAYAKVAPTVALHLRKAIPLAGGMAGGSADAAAALVACAALWGLRLDRSVLAGLAAELGSDVPFALVGGTALGTGRGERVSPVLGRGEFDWVLGLAEGGLATPAVFAELDRRRSSRPTLRSKPDDVLAALRSGDAVRLGRALVNDLQSAALALRPALRRTLAAGTELGALGAVVSGSGPTCAFLARSPEHAATLAAALAAEGVVRAVRRVRGPVPGARVVEV
jgi:4-diphosphocytidyl-2-C-methyl-D-erythritol kinase